MSAFLTYLLKSALLLAVFDVFFLLVMRRSGWFRFNRITLLAGSAVCLLLPLIPIRISVPSVYSVWLEPAVVGLGGRASAAAEAAAGAEAVPWPAVVLTVYVIGAVVALGFYVRSYGAMFRLLKRTSGERCDGYILHLVDREAPSFSWLRHIVISRSDYARYPAILTHERAHVRCGHSIDLLLSSLLTVFQWFNPLVWICRSELKLVHEYEADDFVLKQGIDATQYQLLLVKKAVGEKRFLLANGFNHAQLKNRITMMQIPAKAAWKKVFLLLLIPLLGGSMLLLAEGTSQLSGEPVKYSLVETKPLFQGGDASTFALWVNQHLQYPKEAFEKKIQGSVTLQFVIDKDGSLKNVEALRGPDPLLNDEAVKVISQSPKWTPGYQNGEPVPVIYVFPITFQLK